VDEDDRFSDLPDGWVDVPIGSGWYGYTNAPASVERYGLTLDEYHALLEAQKDCCAICGRKSSCVGPLVVDDDHSANRVRALLCQWCNRGVGQFLEMPEVVRQAADYLERHGSWATREEEPPEDWLWEAPSPGEGVSDDGR
jgi:Recombination endonuclease VII